MVRSKRRYRLTKKTRKCGTDDHGCHSLSDTPSFKFEVRMFVPDGFEVKEWSTEVLSEKDKCARVGECGADRVVRGRLGKNKGRRSGIVCVLSGEVSGWMSWTRCVCGEVKEDWEWAGGRWEGAISNEGCDPGMLGDLI